MWIKVLPPFIGIAILWVAGAIWYWLAGRPDRERGAKAPPAPPTRPGSALPER